jgi:hypothetical protein
MVARQVGMRSITLADGTTTGPTRLGLTDYVVGRLDDGDPDGPPVTAWLPVTFAPLPPPVIPDPPPDPPVDPAPPVVARIEAADDATPLAWRVIPESLVPSV